MLKRLIASLSVTSCAMLVAGACDAGPAAPISSFWVVADTSATYNPVLPSPLTPTTVLNMNWDVMSSSSSFQVSTRPNGGGWLAFVTAMVGYPTGTPIVSYKGAPVSYFGTYYLLDASNTRYGQLDEYYCSCTSGGTFKADAFSINTGRDWYAQMYIY